MDEIVPDITVRPPPPAEKNAVLLLTAATHSDQRYEQMSVQLLGWSQTSAPGSVA